MSQPFDFHKLASALRTLRRKNRLSVNRLARLTGISRRTLGRLEVGEGLRVQSTPSGRAKGLSARTAFKLARFLLGPEPTERELAEMTRLSRFYGKDPLCKFFDVLYDYPAFLFHRGAAEALSEVEGPVAFREYAREYRNAWAQLIVVPPRNLVARLRAFRLQHDLTLVETAGLLDLSKSELHRLERGERKPSPRVRYRILRLLTVPVSFEEMQRTSRAESREAKSRDPRARFRILRLLTLSPLVGHGFSHAEIGAAESGGGKRAASLRRQHAGREGTRRTPSSPPTPPPLRSTGQAAGGDTSLPAAPSMRAPARGRQGLSPALTAKSAWLAALKALLEQPPPRPSEVQAEASPSSASGQGELDKLRHLWLAGRLKSRDLATLLDISQPHLIRLLRGDRRPSQALRDRLEQLLGPLDRAGAAATRASASRR